jgi:hypothetical protein
MTARETCKLRNEIGIMETVRTCECKVKARDRGRKQQIDEHGAPTCKRDSEERLIRRGALSGTFRIGLNRFHCIRVLMAPTHATPRFSRILAFQIPAGALTIKRMWSHQCQEVHEMRHHDRHDRLAMQMR